MAHDDGAQAKMDVMKPGWHVTTGPATILFDSTVRDWTAHRAIPVWQRAPNRSSVAYPLIIEATADRITMSVGGATVLDAPRRNLPSDGIIGLRVNHALNLHVEKLVVSPLASR
jgi:hypothetical protein